MKATVIIPTYNERGNIGTLIDLLEEDFPKIPNHDLGILVIDGNSPDGTAEVVRERMGKWDNINLIVEKEKKGLGAAMVQSIRQAMSELGAEVIVTIDGDLSHDPRKVKELLGEIDRGADYVIGSRYIPGGSIPTDWGPHRKFLSFFGNIIARILGVWEVHDLTPNFRAVRAEILKRMDLENLPRGYAFQIALVCRARDAGAKFSEVPIHFVDRKKGKSKMPPRTSFEALRFLLEYRVERIMSNFKAQMTNQIQNPND